ncbi:hypothetical protein [Rhizorhapis sp. SPR117]|uniref:hypothetical protein n=1 Tax=Rhizorhapis sp. SPR117 TaxID=2912611 RepID=UPI001F3E7029|nr:hypothetical protein [Rhizorhapis sp. SPR117]
MIAKILLAAGSVMLAAVPTSALAESVGYNLRLTVPLYCTVKHQALGYGNSQSGVVSLGTFREYCNAPRGYNLIITYTPGSLRGARIIAGNEEVILDGSGRSVLSRETGPRVRERIIAAIPGENGFDTDRLELIVVPV